MRKKRSLKDFGYPVLSLFFGGIECIFFNFEIASMGEAGRRFIKLKPPM